MSDLESQILELQKEVAYDSKDYPIEVLVNKYTKDIDKMIEDKSKEIMTL